MASQSKDSVPYFYGSSLNAVASNDGDFAGFEAYGLGHLSPFFSLSTSDKRSSKINDVGGEFEKPYQLTNYKSTALRQFRRGTISPVGDVVVEDIDTASLYFGVDLAGDSVIKPLYFRSNKGQGREGAVVTGTPIKYRRVPFFASSFDESTGYEMSVYLPCSSPVEYREIHDNIGSPSGLRSELEIEDPDTSPKAATVKEFFPQGWASQDGADQRAEQGVKDAANRLIMGKPTVSTVIPASIFDSRGQGEIAYSTYGVGQDSADKEVPQYTDAYKTIKGVATPIGRSWSPEKDSDAASFVFPTGIEGLLVYNLKARGRGSSNDSLGLSFIAGNQNPREFQRHNFSNEPTWVIMGEATRFSADAYGLLSTPTFDNLKIYQDKYSLSFDPLGHAYKATFTTGQEVMTTKSVTYVSDIYYDQNVQSYYVTKRQAIVFDDLYLSDDLLEIPCTCSGA